MTSFLVSGEMKERVFGAQKKKGKDGRKGKEITEYESSRHSITRI